MTIKEIVKLAKSIGLYGDLDCICKGFLYMSFGAPHKYTVLFCLVKAKKIYISKTLKWKKTKDGYISFESNDFPNDTELHTVTQYYPSYKLSDNNGIINALNNLGIAYKRCLIEIKKASIKEDFEDDT